jgi:hypothetical protein
MPAYAPSDDVVVHSTLLPLVDPATRRRIPNPPAPVASPDSEPTHPILELQHSVGNYGLARALGRTAPAAPAPAPTAAPVIQRAVMSAAELEKRGGKGKNKKDGTATGYTKILQGVGALDATNPRSGEFATQVEQLQAQTAAWRKKHWFKSMFSGFFKEARAVRDLDKQLSAPEMKAAVTREKFYAAINDPATRAKQEELEAAASQGWSAASGPGAQKLGVGGSNTVFKVTIPTASAGPGGAANKNIKDYAFRFNHSISQETDWEQQDRLKEQVGKGYDRSVYLPQLARALGITTVNQSAKVKDDTPAAITELTKGENLATKLGKGSTLSEIDDNELQETMLYDMVFEASDAHFANYMLGEEGGAQRLKRIDVDDVFDVVNWNYGDPDRPGESLARAGSALAGLPQARRSLSPQLVAKIEKWKPEAMRTAMENAPGTDGRNVFSPREIEKVMANMASLKRLAAQTPTRSARDLFDAYNIEGLVAKGRDATEYTSLLNQNGSIPAEKYLGFNTGAVRGHYGLYGSLGHLNALENQPAAATTPTAPKAKRPGRRKAKARVPQPAGPAPTPVPAPQPAPKAGANKSGIFQTIKNFFSKKRDPQSG